jgi:hypothetical protein
MTNWRPIESAPRSGEELIVRRVVDGLTVYKGAAIWLPASANRAEGWIDPVSEKRVPAPTHWKASGRGHPQKISSANVLGK